MPQLQIHAEAVACTSCNQCTKSCPMSIEVKEKVKAGEIIDAECIKCGACVDICPRHVLSFSIAGKKKEGGMD